jgi:hypothetical protein
MSFLNQLKSQAQSLSTEKTQTRAEIDANTLQTELACKTVWTYISELSKHLNVLVPPAPVFALDKGAVWPAMKLHNFRADARKKMIRNQEVYDTISMGWAISPMVGTPELANIDVDFGPALERVEKILSSGGVKFERKDILVQQDKKQRRVIRFEHTTQANGFITITTDHDNGQLNFRLANTSGFGVARIVFQAERMQPALLDEMAKLIVAQPNQFLPMGMA